MPVTPSPSTNAASSASATSSTSSTRKLTLATIGGVQAELEALDARGVLRWALARYGDRLVLTSSFGPEDVVLIDLLTSAAAELGVTPRVATLDTGRLHQETYDTIARIRQRYQIEVEVFTPAPEDLEPLLRRDGPNGFYDSIDARHACCDARKVRPLRRLLKTADAWITGMRREQNVTRVDIGKIELDLMNGSIAKLNPLADWSREEVWAHIRAHDVPYNPLHDQGYPSIGCAPCTRAVQPGEDERAGRWWWERPDDRECGLHVDHSADHSTTPDTSAPR